MDIGKAIVISAAIVAGTWAVFERHLVVAANVGGGARNGAVYVINKWTGGVTVCHEITCQASESK
jgi:hypothetical protein